MSDKYPQVERSWGSRATWINRPITGNGKVVPADAIVIERSTVPPVRVEPSYIEADRIGRDVTADPDEVHAHALALLAIEAYLREHPPVDEEAEVAKIRDAVGPDAWRRLSFSGVDAIARRLYARGVRVTEATGGSDD